MAPLWPDRGEVAAILSIGVAAFADGTGDEELLADADRAVYAAKEAGRDRKGRADRLKLAAPRLATQL